VPNSLAPRAQAQMMMMPSSLLRLQQLLQLRRPLLLNVVPFQDVIAFTVFLSFFSDGTAA
jgi:hypothetical protein